MLRWKELLEKGKWKKLKKSDWAVLALVGILLLVIAMPIGKNSQTEDGASSSGSIAKDGTASGTKTTGDVKNGQNGTKNEQAAAAGSSGTVLGEEEAYVAYLEDKLENVLSQMDGVGQVEVMVTISDVGESVVEKDKNSTTTVTSESDSAGGERTTTESNTDEQTVYVENQDGTYPYIQKEKLPTIEGVVVVAEGGGSSVVVTNISETVQALLPVEAHRIKVVKMCSKEE